MEHVVALLRERVYGAMACLATLAVLVRYTAPETSAWARVLDVAVATGGLWAASLLADWMAHLGVYRSAPRGRAALRTPQASGQIVEAAVLPLLVLVAAGIGLLSTYTAMWIAMWILVVELGVIALLAVRQAQLRWWQQTFHRSHFWSAWVYLWSASRSSRINQAHASGGFGGAGPVHSHVHHVGRGPRNAGQAGAAHHGVGCAVSLARRSYTAGGVPAAVAQLDGHADPVGHEAEEVIEPHVVALVLGMQLHPQHFRAVAQ